MTLPSPANFTRCRICGSDHGPDFLPWGISGDSPTFEICNECGVEFGYQDTNLEGILAYREQYLNGLSRKRQIVASEEISRLPSQFR